MGERVPIVPKNECYQYPANSQKCQIHCGFQGTQAPLESRKIGRFLWMKQVLFTNVLSKKQSFAQQVKPFVNAHVF